MNVEYINPFLAALKNVFNTMVDLPFTIKNPSLKKGWDTAHDVNGVIGISGQVKGQVVVSFPQPIALTVASTLLGEKISEVGRSCADAIGEIANMVAGDAKKDFPEKDTTISIPTIIIGRNRSVFPTDVPVISIPCRTTGGEFVVEIAVEK